MDSRELTVLIGVLGAVLGILVRQMKKQQLHHKKHRRKVLKKRRRRQNAG